MPPKRKANKPTEEPVDAGIKKKRVDKEEFDGEEGDVIDVKPTENVKPKRGGKAAEQKPAPALESKSRAKGKAPVAKSSKKDAVKSNLDEEESDSSVESKKDAPVKTTRKNEKKVPAPENKRKARGGNEGPSAKTAKQDKEGSPDDEEDIEEEIPASSVKSSKAVPKGKGRGAKATQAKATKKKEDKIVSDEESELSPPEEELKKKPAATKGSKKMIPEVIENEGIELQDSSEDEFQKKPTTAKVGKKTTKKQQEEEVEPEDVSSDESKKKAPVSKRGKRAVKKDVIPKDESEPEDDDDASDDSKKTAPVEKSSNKEVVQEEDSEPEDVSSDDSKKKVAVAKGAKKNVKKDAVTATASRGRPAKAADKKEKLNPTETSYETLDFSSDKKNKAGDVHNLRIASWNVGGIKAWVKKDGLKYVLKEKPDIFCIQETRCDSENFPAEIEEMEDYKFYWHASSKEGYAGVSLWSRIQPIEVQYGIGNEEQDEEGRCITAEFEKYYVVCVYVPNSGRKLVTLPKRLEWNKSFKTFIKELDAKKPVIICGDLNVAHNEIDLANPKTNTKNAGFTPEEREGFTEFLSEGFIDTYRNFNPDTTGAYTFWTYMSKCRSRNVGWRLDYFVTSERLKDNLCDSLIRSPVLGSDHCPIVLFVNI